MTIEEQYKSAVSRILRTLTRGKETEKIFTMWPVLVGVTERFCDFVSPFLQYDDYTQLVDHCIANAVKSYDEEPDDNRKPLCYITELSQAAIALMKLQVHGENRTKRMTWEPFVTPMREWMIRNQITLVRTVKRDIELTEKEQRIAMDALLSHIVTTQEMKTFGLV